MKRILPTLDGTSALIAAKTCLAIVLGLAIALRLDWKPSFGIILIVVLQTPALGATYKKGLLYIAGTLSGAIVGLALVALFVHDRVAFIAAAALVTGFGVYRMQLSANPYAWLIFTVTSMLVGFFSVQDPASTFDIAVMRSSTICLAVVITFLVHGIIWPIRGGTVFERQLLGVVEGSRDLLSLMSRVLSGDEPDKDAARSAETAQINAIAALRGTLDAAAGDTDRFRRFHAGYENLVTQLHDLLLAILALRACIQSPRDSQPGKVLSAGPAMLATVDREMQKLVRDLARPRDGTVDPPASGALIDHPEPIDTAFSVMLVDGIREVAARVHRVRITLAILEDPRKNPEQSATSAHEPFSLTSVNMRKAAGSSLAMLLLGWFFIETQWPMGLMLGMVFAAIAIGLGALLPLIMIRRQLLWSLIIGAAIAAPLYFGIMPGINRYQQLIPWLCVAFFPLLYMMASKPQKLLQYLFSAIFVAALLLLDEQGQSYSFSSFVNMWLGFCGGFGGALAVFGLFSSVVPEREFWQQVRGFFTACDRALQDLARSRPGTPAATAILTAVQQQWVGILKQLRTWSGAIDYKRLPGNDRRKTQALIESIEHLALRLAAIERVRELSIETLDEPLRRLLARFHDACVESLQLIENSLTDLKPIPELPDTRRLTRGIESRCEDLRRSAAGDTDDLISLRSVTSVTAHLYLLAEELNNCRDKVNALDWKAWNQNYL